MKLPLEERQRRQPYYTQTTTEVKREREDTQRKRGNSRVEWTIYVYARGDNYWKKVGKAVRAPNSRCQMKGNDLNTLVVGPFAPA